MSAHELETMMAVIPAPTDKRTVRTKLNERFLDVLYEDFYENGHAAVRDVRMLAPDKYLKMVADLMPKDFNLTHDASDAFASIWQNMQNATPLVIEHDMDEGIG